MMLLQVRAQFQAAAVVLVVVTCGGTILLAGHTRFS
jgi:hypothetical protein